MAREEARAVKQREEESKAEFQGGRKQSFIGISPSQLR
jgi:hypothetical protein